MNSSQLNCRIRIAFDRSGFTLIELLFVIAIIAVLSTMSLGIMRSAQEDAKESATLARIRAIEAILQIELEDYEVRRLPISLGRLRAYAAANPVRTGGADLGVQVRNLKRRILADIINAEMPRPVIDLAQPSGFNFNPDVGVFPTNEPGAGTGSIGFKDWLNSEYPNPPTSKLSDVLANVASAGRVRSWNSIRPRRDPANDIEFNLPGEYLYEILAQVDIDGAPATEQLGPRAIGDSDEDGFLEIVDAWGAPMQLRIWQVDAIEVDDAGAAMPGTDIWADVANVDYDMKVGGVPTGYSVIDPTIPREVNKIRFEVASTRLGF